MKDKHAAILVLGAVAGLSIGFDVLYAKEVVLMITAGILAVVRD